MEVKMNISELRALESEIIELKAQKADLESRAQQVIVYHKYFNGKIQVVKSPRIYPSYTLTGIKERKYSSPMSPSSREYISMDVTLDEALEKGLVTLDTKEDVSRQTKDYVNMSEVVKDIHNEVYKQFSEDLEKANNRATEAEHLSLTIEDKYKKEIITAREAHFRVVDQMTADYQSKVVNLVKEQNTRNENYEAAYKQLKQEFDDFKENKKRISLEKQLEEALETIAELSKKKNKNFFTKLF